ncbi:MAG: T9SS type A sorting domain-containing protein [Bacteroidales bacterium]|nr:T9SS type A sorting domain-containing protein [Bacteroidales bacterium]
MKSYFFRIFIILLTFAATGPLTAQAQDVSEVVVDQPAYTLYPVTEFNADMAETMPYMTWQIPELPGGGVPPGLLGYRIYRDGDTLAYLSDPASTIYYDGSPMEPGMRVYSLTAYYDLTPYGFPGLFEESEAVEDSVYYTSCPLPFGENWDQASFGYNEWLFEPSQGNWNISILHGNPLPTAVFEGDPTLLNYSHRIMSRYFGTAYYFCAPIFLEFDYKLEDVTASSTEKLFVEVEYDDSWHTLLELTNNGSTDWIHQVIEIPGIYPFNTQIGFRAEGVNSSNISRWMVDNIWYDAQCHPPLNTSLDFSGGNIVTLKWNPPCDLQITDSSFFTYHIRRTDSSGLPPYEVIASGITDTFFNNYLEPGQVGGHFRYFVVAEHVFNDGYFNMGICYGYGDTVSYIPLLRPPDALISETEIYPNPADKQLTINGIGSTREVCVYNFLGNTILKRTCPEDKIVLDVSSWPAGVYFVRISTREGSVVRKLSVLH